MLPTEARTFTKDVDSEVAWAISCKASRNDGHWLVPLLSIKIGDRIVFSCEEEPCCAAVDTGATWMMGPGNQMSDVLEAMDPEADCSGMGQLRTMEISIAGLEAPIDLSLSPAEYVDRYDGVCSAMLSPLMMPPGVPLIWVIGQPVLRKYVTTFDVFSSSVGFAPAASEEAGLASGRSNLRAASRAFADVDQTGVDLFLRTDNGQTDAAKVIERKEAQEVVARRGFRVAAEQHFHFKSLLEG